MTIYEFDQELFSYLYEQAKNAILNINPKDADDIYVISFLLECLEDDLRRPRFILGYNTEKRFRSQIKKHLMQMKLDGIMHFGFITN